jgi:hypothetical protein
MAHLSDNDLRKKFASQIQSSGLSDAQVKKVIEAARFDATGANKRDAAENAYENYLDEYNRANQQRQMKMKSRLNALEQNMKRTREDYQKGVRKLDRLIDPLPASAGYLWGPMRDALKNND